MSPKTRGARHCTNPECEFGGRWVVGKMVRLKNGKFLCRGRGCHTIYEAREAIDLRHTCGSLLIQAGVRPKDVQTILRHRR